MLWAPCAVSSSRKTGWERKRLRCTALHITAVFIFKSKAVLGQWISVQHTRFDLLSNLDKSRPTLKRVLGNKRVIQNLIKTLGLLSTKTEEKNSCCLCWLLSFCCWLLSFLMVFLLKYENWRGWLIRSVISLKLLVNFQESNLEALCLHPYSCYCLCWCFCTWCSCFSQSCHNNVVVLVRPFPVIVVLEKLEAIKKQVWIIFFKKILGSFKSSTREPEIK